MPPGLAAMVNKEKEPEKRRDDDRNKDRERGKPRNIDHFMEELKREQEAREKRTADREQRRSDRKSQAAGMGLPVDLTPTRLEEVLDDDKLPGSFDDGDPQTTNLYVGNLSPQVYSKYNWHVYYSHALILIPPFSKRSWSMFLRAVVFECIFTLL
jgi:U2-associated protein SR140